VTEWLRWGWGQLTSMRTALLLLFLLALAAIPGSIIPQQSISPIEVMDYKEQHPQLDAIWEALGMYNVYTSSWFSAIYLLLFVSLIGCITPRIARFARDLRKPPPKLPRRLDRLPARALVAGHHDGVLDDAARWLRSKRYRVRREAEGISAERGYLREFGNLLFHASLVGVLVGLAWSNLGGFMGSVVVVEGRGFANVITQYDDFTAGAWVDTDHLEEFSLEVDRFEAAFETGRVQRGAARVFDAHVRVTEDGETREHLLTVNQPVTTAGGTQVNLLGHGYAPIVTVTDGNGDVAFSGPVVFLPQDGNFSSVGVVKVPDGRPERLAFEGFFFPTALLDQDGPKSVFPDALDPELWINAWRGAPAEETGVPESIYTLNTAGLEPVLGDDEDRFRARMKPGAGLTLPDGLGSISFDGYSRWVKLQMSETPGNPVALASLAIGTLGLCLSLFIKPRRLFVRVGEDGVAIGGLDRSDTALGLEDEVEALAAALTKESG
jgi:cytochrome c biogenesis protein